MPQRRSLDPKVANSLATAARNRSEQGEAPRLSHRERDVLQLVAEGVRSAAIAERLHISLGTVEAHRRNIRRKLGLHTVAELTRYAVREGLVAP